MHKDIIKWIIVIIFLIVIFLFSNMDTNESNGKSEKVLSSVTTFVIGATNNIGLTNIKDVKPLVKKFNYPFRKIMHFMEYLILSLLLISVLKEKYIIVILVCFTYSLTDEFHQTFINGRTGQFIDCLIDTSGAIVGMLLYWFTKTRHDKKLKVLK